MSEVMACSHIFVVSEEMEIVDLGEYSGQHLHVSSGLSDPVFYPDDTVINRLRLPFKETIDIEHPSTKTKQIFVSADDKIPITYIFHCSNENNDCIFLGTIRDQYKNGDSTIIVIDPYNFKTVTGRMYKEADVLNELAERGRRYCEEPQITIQRPNPIVERIKKVVL